MTAAEAQVFESTGARVWPISVRACHALGEPGFLPEKTELLSGQVMQKE